MINTVDNMAIYVYNIVTRYNLSVVVCLYHIYEDFVILRASLLLLIQSLILSSSIFILLNKRGKSLPLAINVVSSAHYIHDQISETS